MIGIGIEIEIDIEMDIAKLVDIEVVPVINVLAETRSSQSVKPYGVTRDCLGNWN